jgi:excisionase family DNA binding protein
MSAQALPEFMSVAHTAEAFGVSTDAVRGWIKRGRLPVKKVGRRVFIAAALLNDPHQPAKRDDHPASAPPSHVP